MLPWFTMRMKQTALMGFNNFIQCAPIVVTHSLLDKLKEDVRVQPHANYRSHFNFVFTILCQLVTKN